MHRHYPMHVHSFLCKSPIGASDPPFSPFSTAFQLFPAHTHTHTHAGIRADIGHCSDAACDLHTGVEKKNSPAITGSLVLRLFSLHQLFSACFIYWRPTMMRGRLSYKLLLSECRGTSIYSPATISRRVALRLGFVPGIWGFFFIFLGRIWFRFCVEMWKFSLLNWDSDGILNWFRTIYWLFCLALRAALELRLRLVMLRIKLIETYHFFTNYT